MRLSPDTVFHCDAFLFDMDGTVIDSTDAVERVWTRWGESRGIDILPLLKRVHGIRAIDTLRSLNIPGLNAEKENKFLLQAEINEQDGIKPVPGAPDLLASLSPSQWAIVTSAEISLMQSRFLAAGLPFPHTFVTAEDVPEGKPNPLCYKIGAERLGVPIERCIVFEDAPAGLTAGHRAGAKVIAIASTLPDSALEQEDWIPDMRCLRVEPGENGTRLKLVVTSC